MSPKTKEVEGDAGDGTNDDGGGGDDNGTRSGVTLEQVQQVAEETAKRVVESLLADDGTDDGAGDGGGDGGTGHADGGPASNRDVERTVGAQVREELDRIRGTEKLEERVGAVEKAVEKAPVKMGKLTRAIWGGDE